MAEEIGKGTQEETQQSASRKPGNPTGWRKWLYRLLAMTLVPHHVLVDGNQLPSLDGLGWSMTARAIVAGDATQPAISAASILAKTARDNYMNQMDTVYPAYSFATHKGYGTPDHQRLLELHGPCPLHRRSFAPLRLMLEAIP